MKTQHTKVNWEMAYTHGQILKVYSENNYERSICTVTIPLDGKNNGEIIRKSEANAKLIAAAPELLDVLLQARTELLHINADCNINLDQQVMTAIEQAIKKATE